MKRFAYTALCFALAGCNMGTSMDAGVDTNDAMEQEDAGMQMEMDAEAGMEME